MWYVAYSVRMLAFSVSAFAIAACVPMSLSDPTLFRIEPILGDAPTSGMQVTEVVPPPPTVEEVEAQLAALDAKITDLKQMLQIMSPGTRTQEFAVAGAPESATAALYAPAPNLPQAKSLFSWTDACTTFAAPSTACRTVEPVRASN